MRIHNLATPITVALFVSAAAGQNTGLFESHGDLGVTPKGGSIEGSAAPGEYRITGGGANIWGTEDAMQFLWNRLSGDVPLTPHLRFFATAPTPHPHPILI